MKNGAFDRVICDQGHQVKDPESGRHQSVALLGASHYWFITATPLWNRPGDLQGYLKILHRSSFDESIPPGTLTDLTIEAYRAFENVRFSRGMELPTYLLSPKALARLALNPSDWDDLGRFVLLVVMGMISLSRNLGELIDIGPDAEAVVLGGQIPPARIGTVDLRFPPEYQVKHNEKYAKYINSFVRVSDNSLTNKPPLRAMRTRLGFPNPTDEQMARLLAFSPRLHDFVKAGKKEDIDLDASVKSLTVSFREYWERTVQDKSSTMPSSGYDIAHYLAEDSPKLRYLLQIFSDEGLLPNPAASGAPRFIIFCINPRVRWLVEMFVTALGIGFSAIRLGTRANAKFKISADFTNRGSSDRVLLSTFQCTSQGLNLHRCCSRIIVLQTPRNLSTLVQAIGRVHRLGQTEEQKAWILFQDHTIQRWAEYSLTRKALPALIAEIEARIEGFQGQEASAGKEREGMIMTMAADEICRMLGQSESRLKYNNPHDLGDPRFDIQQTGSLHSETSSESDLTSKDVSDVEFEGYQDVMDRPSDTMISTTTSELAETDTSEGNGQ
ncbi:uncharacterized protein LDX57_000239 [Aspergillus melleus]|uniref:uncharacterized protein n=1 Tax=Aspergillus melleus TaxID=138277 RepID=UPI001E8DF051|nr:uncharacterized protein LDX57_000239 [Aspergillus melleus]KAH8422486.1 hypothetical protein LDX57_000239 [Aspergillus melleus]